MDSGTCGTGRLLNSGTMWTLGRVDLTTWTCGQRGFGTCGIGDLWTRRCVDSVVLGKSLLAVLDRFQRLWSAIYFTVTALSTEVNSTQRVVYFVGSRGKPLPKNVHFFYFHS